MQVKTTTPNQTVQNTPKTQSGENKPKPNLTVVVTHEKGSYEITGDKIDLGALQKTDDRLAKQLSLYDKNQDNLLEAQEVSADKKSVIYVNFTDKPNKLYDSSNRAPLIELDGNGQIVQSKPTAEVTPQPQPVEQVKPQPVVEKKPVKNPNMPGATVREEDPNKKTSQPKPQPVQPKPATYNHGVISIDASKPDTELQWALQLLERTKSGYAPTPVENTMYEKIMQKYIIPGATP